jgi:hypothetical protein
MVTTTGWHHGVEDRMAWCGEVSLATTEHAIVETIRVVEENGSISAHSLRNFRGK